jgi:predicted esterase
MPVISMFYGIIVLMYYFDNRKHHQPHIHVQYGEEEAVVSIPDGEVIEGQLRAAKLKLVNAWVELHPDELMADWQLAVNGQSLFKIEPLR